MLPAPYPSIWQQSIHINEESMIWSDELERLVLAADYSELSEKEQHWLREQGLSPEEHHQWRSALLAARAGLAESPAPPANLQFELIQRFRQLHRSPSVSAQFSRWLAVAAAMGGAFFIGRWSVPSSPMSPPSGPELKIVRQIDTLYQDQIVEKVVYVRDTQYVVVPSPVLREETFQEMPATAAADSIWQNAPSNGRTAKEDAQLMDMVVKVY